MFKKLIHLIKRPFTRKAAHPAIPQAAYANQRLYELVRHDPVLEALGVEWVDSDAKVVVHELTGLRAFWVARGGHIEATEARKNSLDVQRDMVGFHLTEFEDRLREGLVTWDELIEAGAERVRAEVILRIFSLFGAAVPVSSPYYAGALKTGRSGRRSMDVPEAIVEVDDAVTDGSHELVVVGRRKALAKFTVTAGEDAGPFAIKDYELVALHDVKDLDGKSMYPDDVVFVLSKTAYRFAFFGGPRVKEWVDDHWYQHLQADWEFGGVIYRPDQVRRLSHTAVELIPVAEVDNEPMQVPEEEFYAMGSFEPIRVDENITEAETD